MCLPPRHPLALLPLSYKVIIEKSVRLPFLPSAPSSSSPTLLLSPSLPFIPYYPLPLTPSRSVHLIYPSSPHYYRPYLYLTFTSSRSPLLLSLKFLHLLYASAFFYNLFSTSNVVILRSKRFLFFSRFGFWLIENEGGGGNYSVWVERASNKSLSKYL